MKKHDDIVKDCIMIGARSKMIRVVRNIEALEADGAIEEIIEPMKKEFMVLTEIIKENL